MNSVLLALAVLTVQLPLTLSRPDLSDTAPFAAVVLCALYRALRGKLATRCLLAGGLLVALSASMAAAQWSKLPRVGAGARGEQTTGDVGVARVVPRGSDSAAAPAVPEREGSADSDRARAQSADSDPQRAGSANGDPPRVHSTDGGAQRADSPDSGQAQAQSTASDPQRAGFTDSDPQRVHSTDGGSQRGGPCTADGDAPLAVEAFVDAGGSRSPALWLEGVVEEAARSERGSARLSVAVEELWELDGEQEPSCKVRGRVSLYLRHAYTSWFAGDRIGFESRLAPMVGFGNPGEFDWPGWNARRGIRVSAFVFDDRTVRRQGTRAPGKIEAARRAIARAARAAGPAGDLLAALLVGDRSGLSEALRSDIRDAGLAHAVAISGLHMGLVAGVVFWLLSRGLGLSERLFSSYDLQRPAALGAAIAVSGYGAISGGGVSVERSLLMTLAALFALWRGSLGDGMRALALAAIVAALRMPGVICEAGFQLSFLAVAALLLHARKRMRARELAPTSAPGPPPTSAPGPAPASAPAPGLTRRCLLAAWELVTISTLCWAVTAPLVVHHFNRISLLAPLSNLVAALPLAAAVTLGLGAALLLAVCAPAAQLLFAAAERSAAALASLAQVAASLPFAAVSTPAPAWPLTLTLCALPLVLQMPAERRRRGLASLLALAALLSAQAAHERFRSDRLDAVFVSVGQGDATVLRLPGGRVAVVDASLPGRGRQVVGPLLRRMYIGRIDYLVVSHMQYDHCGGIPELLADFEVGELWYPGGACDSQEYRAVRGEADSHGVRVVAIGAAGRGESNVPRAADARAADARGAGACAADASSAAACGEEARGADAPRAAACGEEAREAHEVRGASWSIKALWPLAGEGRCDDNDRSVVVSVEFAGRRILLTGDIEARAEAALVSRAGAAAAQAAEGARALTAVVSSGAPGAGGLPATVLKVPHHGSSTSSTAPFVAAVAPVLAVASAGRHNRYGFPHREVAARYRAGGAAFLSTSTAGAVQVKLWQSGRLEWQSTALR